MVITNIMNLIIMNHTIKNKHKEEQTMPILRINEVTVHSYSMSAKLKKNQKNLTKIIKNTCFLFFIFVYLY